MATVRHLIPAIRERLDGAGGPYVIENVAGAPVRHDLMLCGEMFGLDVIGIATSKRADGPPCSSGTRRTEAASLG